MKGFRQAKGQALLTSVLSVLVLFFSSPLKGTAAQQTRPNVLFIAVDDMNDWVGCLGGYSGKPHTPNIDALAERGVLFTNAHCASPVCCPSRTAVMSGLLPSSTGIYNNQQWWKPHRPDLITLPIHFRNHGYTVAGAGKLFHHTAGNNPPNQWDQYHQLLFRDDPWFRAHRLNYPWSAAAPKPDGFPFSKVPGLPHENDWGALPDKPEASYDDARTTDFAIQFLTNASPDKPFFLACGLFRPHLPWYAPPEYFERHPLDQVQVPRCAGDELEDIPQEGRKLAGARREDLRRIREAKRDRHAVQAYLASISFADAQVGRLLQALQNSPHAGNTIIVFWSDHGWHLGEKQHWHKSTLWEEATRVPLIIAGPEISAARCSAPVSLIDMFPTLNVLCTLPGLPQHDGQSLVPLMNNPTELGRGFALTQFQPGQCAVRSRYHRLIRYANGDEELYDHRTDPAEQFNLASRTDPSLLNIKERLRAHLPSRIGWAAPAPRKAAYRFDAASYSWKTKAGEVIKGEN